MLSNPSTMADPLSSLFIQICTFLLLNVLELGPLSNLIFAPLPSLDFLSNWCKNLRSFTWGFLLPFGPKGIRTGEEGYGSYLMILSSFSKGLIVFSSLFSWFSSSSFPLLVSPPSISFQPVLDSFSL